MADPDGANRVDKLHASGALDDETFAAVRDDAFQDPGITRARQRGSRAAIGVSVKNGDRGCDDGGGTVERNDRREPRVHQGQGVGKVVILGVSVGDTPVVV